MDINSQGNSHSQFSRNTKLKIRFESIILDVNLLASKMKIERQSQKYNNFYEMVGSRIWRCPKRFCGISYPNYHFIEIIVFLIKSFNFYFKKCQFGHQYIGEKGHLLKHGYTD